MCPDVNVTEQIMDVLRWHLQNRIESDMASWVFTLQGVETLKSASMRTLPSVFCSPPQEVMTKASLTETHTMTSTPLALNFSKSCT